MFITLISIIIHIFSQIPVFDIVKRNDRRSGIGNLKSDNQIEISNVEVHMRVSFTIYLAL